MDYPCPAGPGSAVPAPSQSSSPCPTTCRCRSKSPREAGGLRSDVDARREIEEITVVRDFVQIEPAKEGAIAVVAAHQIHAIAAAIRGTVIREHLRAEIALVVFRM